MKIRTIAPGLAFLLALAAHAQSPASDLFGRNLLKDPGAEATEAAEAGAWFDAETYKGKGGRCTREAYGQTTGVFPKGWGAKNAHGEKLFRFSTDDRIEIRTLTQRIDMTALADSIDRKKVIGRFSAHMASIVNPGLRGQVVVEYLNVDGKPIQKVNTPFRECHVQGDQWQLVKASQSAIVPVGARYAVVHLQVNTTPDATAGGSFVMDDVSFELLAR